MNSVTVYQSDDKERAEELDVSAGKQSADELEHDIEKTQTRIAEGIDELSHRLNPSHIKEKAAEQLNLGGLNFLLGDLRGTLGETVKESGGKILQGIKHNPMATVLVGLGVGVAAVGGVVALGGGPGSSPKALNKKAYDERLRDMMDTIENDKNKNSEASSGLGEKLHQAKDAVGEKLQGAKEVVGEKLQGVKETVSGGAGQVKDVARQGISKAKDATAYGAQRAKEGLGHFLEAQPLAVGAVALLAGAAVGLLLPRTHYEDSMMGERSDALISQAKGKVGEVVETAKGTVAEVAQAAKDTAKEVVQTAKDPAKEAVNV